MKYSPYILFILLILALAAWVISGCAEKQYTITIDPDWKNSSINYYWPGEPGTPSDNAITLDCRTKRSISP